MVVVMVLLFIVTITSALVAIHGAGRPPEPMRPEVLEKLLAVEFRGIVVANQRMAHAFDAGSHCRVTIKCVDGTTATLTTSIFEEDWYPVGAKVVKRAGQTRPERVADTEPWP
jgi:hypothetical protein